MAAFLLGELDEMGERHFDAHLLECEECWQAVQEDRDGRRALELLRVSAPIGLSDRIALALSIGPAVSLLSSTGGVQRHRRRTRLAVAVATACAVLAGVLTSLALSRPAPTDPPQLTTVIAMLGPAVQRSGPLLAGEHLVIGGQALVVRSVDFSGRPGLVATSTSPFPMPHAMRLMAGSSNRAWMATDGTVALYGVNRPSGERSMVVVAAVPVTELPEMAAHFHLI